MSIAVWMSPCVFVHPIIGQHGSKENAGFVKLILSAPFSCYAPNLRLLPTPLAGK